MLTYFVVQSFARGNKGSISADAPIEARSRDQAQRLAERLSASKAGVVAFSRTGDPTTGDYEDAVIICLYGTVPDLDEPMAMAS